MPEPMVDAELSTAAIPARQRRWRRRGALLGAAVAGTPMVFIAASIFSEARTSAEPHVAFWVVVELISVLAGFAIPIVTGALLGAGLGWFAARIYDARTRARAASTEEYTDVAPGTREDMKE